MDESWDWDDADSEMLIEHLKPHVPTTRKNIDRNPSFKGEFTEEAWNEVAMAMELPTPICKAEFQMVRSQ